MFKDEVSIQYQGFHPSEFTRSHVSLVMSELQDEAPYGATLKGTFSRRDDQFKATVTIYSSAGRFFATATGRKLKQVTDQILRQLRRQLEHWKSRRSRPEHNVLPHGLNNQQIKEVYYDSSDSVA
jgi:ribosome-associated translation inhibitor RaiA